MNNIAFILLDQVRLDMLGTYGHKVVKTPNMDAIAADGIKFTNAFTPASVCGPARTSLFTGQMPSNHELMRNSEKGGQGDPKLDNPNIISEMADYDNYLIGKWHVGKTVLPRDFGFKGHNFDGYGYPGSGVYKNMVFAQGPTQEPRYQEWLKEKGYEIPEVTNAYFGENPHLRVQELCGLLSGTREATLPFFVVDEAKKAILEAKKENKPFFVWMNFWGPHTPCVIPEPYYSMYKPEDVVLDKSFYHPMEGKPLHYKDIAKMWGVWDASEDRWKEIICKFWGYITLIDDAIGEFVKFLKEQGLYESLFLAITADHGDAMGAHKLIEKGEFMFETTYRIPMIIKDPLANRKGVTDDNFVYLHDLTPTCNEVAGKKAPDFFDGESLLSILREGKNNNRKGILGQLDGHFVAFEQRMWRRKDYKLVFNATDVGELYDLQNDPEEIHNLFYDDNFIDIKKEMLDELYSEMVKIKDPLANWLYRIINEI
ncbi:MULTISPECIES: sulfatase-like hydrolase/transferase [Fusobacterium]|jgi:arylsulfatase A-like enzyme|uniref:Sulfatase-like hydrolase/transferase n=1 Tax=Fusobacterium hominis TaxID=2764326 RepID=A0A7G9GWE0_9FUSO|nr:MULTISPECIES: sulfatase-like hydrolase/transferase [Fusobacterium]QNM15122.1 sulfatase-like hydrolase/transferase [Fusobacterium hominis]